MFAMFAILLYIITLFLLLSFLIFTFIDLVHQINTTYSTQQNKILIIKFIYQASYILTWLNFTIYAHFYYFLFYTCFAYFSKIQFLLQVRLQDMLQPFASDQGIKYSQRIKCNTQGRCNEKYYCFQREMRRSFLLLLFLFQSQMQQVSSKQLKIQYNILYIFIIEQERSKCESKQVSQLVSFQYKVKFNFYKVKWFLLLLVAFFYFIQS
ncbi:hypothetical protein ABPG74_014646 [Tetrahymena malaccensis]